MKKRLLFLFVFSFSMLNGLFAQDSSSVNQLDNDGLKHGKWIKYSPKGEIIYSGSFSHGKPIGEFRYYFQTGELKSILNHLENDLVEVTHYYQNGEKMATGFYKEKERHGLWKNYGAGGIVVSEGNYISDKKNGIWILYYPSGQVTEKTTFNAGIEEGDYLSYYENGQLRQEANYINGDLEGATSFYKPDGKKKSTGQYYRSTRDGVWVYFDDEENPYRKIEFDKGKRITPFFDDEQPEDWDMYRDNVKDELDYEDMEGEIKYNGKKK